MSRLLCTHLRSLKLVLNTLIIIKCHGTVITTSNLNHVLFPNCDLSFWYFGVELLIYPYRKRGDATALSKLNYTSNSIWTHANFPYTALSLRTLKKHINRKRLLQFDAQQANYLNIMCIHSRGYEHLKQCFHSVCSFPLSNHCQKQTRKKPSLPSILMFSVCVHLFSSLNLILLFALHSLPQKWGWPWPKNAWLNFPHKLRTLSSSHTYFSC